MSTNFKIFNDKNFAKRCGKPNTYVCYRTVICHALLNKLIISDQNKAANSFNNLSNAITQETTLPNETDFLRLYIVPMEDDKNGFLLVDDSKGHYPLVFYPHQNRQGAPRSEALKKVITDLNIKKEKILTLLDNADSWDNTLQKNLQEIFTYKSDE